jgi:hypothetical protein
MILILRESCDSLPTDFQCRDTIRYTLDGSWEESMEGFSEILEGGSLFRIFDICYVEVDSIHRRE